MTVKMRQHIERMIVRRFLLDGIAAGYKFQVEADGKLLLPQPSIRPKEILDAMFSVDEEYLWVYKTGCDNPLGWALGWVYLVYGNDGTDVISDYTINLEPVMAGAIKVAAKYD
jgi:hypothetical protein